MSVTGTNRTFTSGSPSQLLTQSGHRLNRHALTAHCFYRSTSTSPCVDDDIRLEPGHGDGITVRIHRFPRKPVSRRSPRSCPKTKLGLRAGLFGSTRMTSRLLREKKDAPNHDDRDDQGRDGTAQCQATMVQRLVKEVADRRTKRSSQNESGPEQKDP